MSENDWSNSKLTTLQMCPERFRRRYIEKEETGSTRRMGQGSAFHRVTAEIHKRQFDAKEKLVGPTTDLTTRRAVLLNAIPSTEEARDLGAAAWKEVADQGVVYTKDELAEAPALIWRGRTEDAVVGMSALYAEEVAPKIDPLYVERKITVKPQDSDITVRGQLDLGHEDPLRGEIIRDNKTSAKSPNKRAADESQQLTMYSMLRWAETGSLPAGVALDYMIRTKTGILKTVSLESTRRLEDVQTLVNRINVAVDAVKKGVFVPAQPGVAWWCSPAWCEYWTTCPYVCNKAGEVEEE